MSSSILYFRFRQVKKINLAISLSRGNSSELFTALRHIVPFLFAAIPREIKMARNKEPMGPNGGSTAMDSDVSWGGRWREGEEWR